MADTNTYRNYLTLKCYHPCELSFESTTSYRINSYSELYLPYYIHFDSCIKGCFMSNICSH